MSQLLKIGRKLYLLPLFIAAIASSCEKDMNILLDDSALNGIGMTAIDSFSISTSTAQLELLPANATGLLLVGRAALPETGTIQSTSYFRLAPGDLSLAIPENAAFDSLNLILKPNSSHYFFGDTTKTQKFTVHEVVKTIETTTIPAGTQNIATPFYVAGPAIFSTQKFDYNDSPLGSLSFNPKIKGTDTLAIRLSNELGLDFFDKIKSRDIKFNSLTNFQEYFKGMAIVADASNSSIIGYNDSLEVRINYSYLGTDGLKKSAFKILQINQKDYQYNQITYDRKGTKFEALSETNKVLSSELTDGMVYIQNGSGTVAKIDFPTLKDFMLNEHVAINKAELVIETNTPADGLFPAQQNLVLLVADQQGIPISYIPTPYSTSIQQATYRNGTSISKSATYTFNMFSYLQTLKNNPNELASLYISGNFPNLYNSSNTVFIAQENGKPKIKFNIVYTKFE